MIEETAIRKLKSNFYMEAYPHEKLVPEGFEVYRKNLTPEKQEAYRNPPAWKRIVRIFINI